MKTINEINIDNLKILIEKYDTQANLSDKIDKPAAQISQWVAGYRNMSASTKRQIEEGLGLPVGWLDTPHSEDGEIVYSDVAWGAGDSEDPEEGFIRYDVLNVTVKLGDGFINPDYLEVVDTVTVAEEWARHNLGSGYRKMQVVSTKGDSMRGTIEEGDVLFVDVGFNHYAGEGIYIIHTPDGLRAKRLQLLLNGDLKVISDNKAYEAEIISCQDLESVVICGKVKGRWRLETF